MHEIDSDWCYGALFNYVEFFVDIEDVAAICWSRLADPFHAVAALILFRYSDARSLCQGAFDGSSGAGYNCCYIGESIAAVYPASTKSAQTLTNFALWLQ